MDELEQILEHIRLGQNFLLSGGAGSGKTYSLVQVIKEVIQKHPAEKIFCMTYTNVAVKEIEERVNHENLKVSTIHDFLWGNIKHFQKEIKASLIDLANDSDSKIKIDSDINPIPTNFFDTIKQIQYKEYLKIKEGIISHDEVIILAEYMFKTYIKLCDILKDKYKFIFVDEYQDTHKEVVDILLMHLQQSNRENIIGFFGDAMQSIYETGVNDINSYIEEGLIYEVRKQQNRRSPQLVIDLANRIRTDGIVQEPSTDIKAPNMLDGVVKTGNIKFIYSNSSNLDNLRTYLGWDFSNAQKTKELNLTHNLIADKAGFENLMSIYDKDQILKFRDKIKKYIKENNIQEDFTSRTFGYVIQRLQEGKTGRELMKVSPSSGAMQAFIDSNQELFDYAKEYNYHKLSSIYLDKEQLLDDKKQTEDEEKKKGSKRDNLIKHLFKIQKSISLYQTGKYNEFLKATDYKINTIQDKRNLQENIEQLVNVEGKTIEQVIQEAHQYGICVIDDNLNRFFDEKEYVYYRVKEVPFSEFQKLFNYLEGKTPFTTQHKTKGDEFDNVLVVLDNGGWSQYNFKYLFDDTIRDSLSATQQESYPRILNRTKKLFYVCCTRTKENLVIFYHEPSDSVITKAQEWFGVDNVIAL